MIGLPRVFAMKLSIHFIGILNNFSIPHSPITAHVLTKVL